MLFKGLTTTLALAILGASGTLAAAPIIVSDNYVGADANSAFNSTYYGDVVGDDDKFDISSMVVDQAGTQFDFTINTQFAGKSGNLYHNLTQGETGIGYGDLFLANNWAPEGSSPYIQDDATNGTDWTWGLRLSNRYNNDGGEVSLFRLQGSNLDTSILSDNLMSGGDWRRGQEVLIDDGANAADYVTYFGSVGSWALGTGQLNINADLSQSDLLNGDTLAFHWGMTCANDVIEGEVDLAKKVPEPGTIGLTALALVGMLLMRRRSPKA